MTGMARAALGASLLVAATPGWADPDTHRLTISARDIQGDCGAGGCVPVCTFVARLTNISPSDSPEVGVRFYFLGHPGLEQGAETSFGFDFPAIGKGNSEEARDYVMGMPCKTIQVRRVEGEIDGSSYLQVDFPGLEAPRLPARDIVDGPSQTLPERG